MNDPKDSYVAHVNRVLVDFERQTDGDTDLTRVVFAIIIQQTFKRYIAKFGIKSTKKVLRHLYGMTYKAEQHEDTNTQRQIRNNLKPKPDNQ